MCLGTGRLPSVLQIAHFLLPWHTTSDYSFHSADGGCEAAPPNAPWWKLNDLSCPVLISLTRKMKSYPSQQSNHGLQSTHQWCVSLQVKALEIIPNISSWKVRAVLQFIKYQCFKKRGKRASIRVVYSIDVHLFGGKGDFCNFLL